MAPKTALVTGANRGIGLELVKQLASREGVERVVATCRDAKAAKDLSTLADASEGRVVILELDVADAASFSGFAERLSSALGDSGLHLLINNAGIMPKNRSLEDTTPEDLRDAYLVNCVGPLLLSRELMPLVAKACDAASKRPVGIDRAAVVYMSTGVASVGENSSGSRVGGYAYRCSKSALNQAMKTMAVDMKDKGILIMSMHPGWVQTGMGGSSATLTTEECVRTMLETLDGLNEKDHGSFKRYNNTDIGW